MKITSTHHARSRRRHSGVALLEVSLGLAGLVMLSMILLKISINSIAGQQWTIMQTMTDAYLTREIALGRRTSFEDLTASESQWPLFPQIATQEVTLGLLPDGNPMTATLSRTRRPDPGNLPSAGGNGTTLTNPVGMETWRVQSFVTYSIREREYVKGRTVMRIR